MSKLDLANFKKVGQTKSHTIFEHPDGHVIHISNASLKPAHKKEMKRLPHYAEGTDQPVNPEDFPEAPSQDPSLSNEVRNLVSSQGNVTPQLEGNFGAQVPDPAAGASPTNGPTSGGEDYSDFLNSQDPYGQKAEETYATQGTTGQIADVQKIADAQIQQAKAELGARQGIASQQQTQLDNFQKNYNNLEAERQSVSKDIMNHLIDPQHYQHSLGMAQKMSTGIGLLLGGMSAGTTGQANPALTMLQNNIKNDIEAQQSNLGARKSLLEANLKQFGNLRDASQMTHVMLQDKLANDISVAALKSGNPLIKAKADFATHQLMNDSAARLRQIAVNRTMIQGMPGQGGNPGAPSGQMPDSIDPNLQQSWKLDGQKYYAKSPEEASKAQEASSAINQLEQATRDINEFNKGGTSYTLGSKLGLSDRQGTADSLNAVSKGAIARLEAQGGSIARLADTFRNAMPEAGAFFQTEQQGRSKGIGKVILEAKRALTQSHSISGPTLAPLPKGQRAR